MTGPEHDDELFAETQRLRDQLLFIASRLSVFVTDLRREVDRRAEGRGRDDGRR